ncbi:MAG: Crp/Fnr family transcriptional regulator [Xanthobacteraceae bacterium]|nr:Crp/Fnr family transcriptional regulator [Xanthobacteraceae bacterium]
MQLDDRVAALKQVPILGVLSGERLEALARTCKWQDYEAGEQILNYHDSSTEVFFLASGRARVIIYSAEGKAVIFTDMGPGSMFGEIAAIDRGVRSAGVDSVERSTIASLTASQFESLLLKEPAVAVATLRHVASEVRRLSERVLEFSTLAVRNRIHAELLRLSADARQENGQALLSPAPSLSDIANRISSHREAVSREMSHLTSIGLLRREGGDLRVLDADRLERLVREAKGE